MVWKFFQVTEETSGRCADILQKNFIERGKSPSCKIISCGGCYVKHKKDDFPNAGNYLGQDWEEGAGIRYERVRIRYQFLTHFQCDLCHFRDPYMHSADNERLVVTIWRTFIDNFGIQEPVTVRGNLTMMKNMRVMNKEELDLKECLPPFGEYILKYDVGMVLAHTTLRLSLRKGMHKVPLKWDIILKGTLDWDNVYGYGVLDTWDNTYE